MTYRIKTRTKITPMFLPSGSGQIAGQRMTIGCIRIEDMLPS